MTNRKQFIAGGLDAYKRMQAQIGLSIAEMENKVSGGMRAAGTKKAAGTMKPALDGSARLTVNGRKKIADAQRKRWAEARAMKLKSGKKKPKTMAAGR